MAEKYFSEHTGTEIDLDVNEGLNNQPKSEYVWDDWSFNVNNLRINPSTSKPDFNQTEIAYLFDDSATETLIGSGISSHMFKLGEAGMTWRPHVHWIQKASGIVIWELQYRLTPANEIESGSWTTLVTDENSNEFTYTSGNLHQITIFPYIDASNFDSTAFIMDFKLSRLGGDIGDTYVGDAFFKSFDIHVPIDQLGSRQEFVK